MTKLILTAKGALELKAGRKVAHRFVTGVLSTSALSGIVAAFDGTSPSEADVYAAIDAANLRRGSVIPNGYRYAYGADQNCGDRMATVLTAYVTKPEGVDLDAVGEVARDNGVADRFDAWMVKGLNPGMVRMNLGNVLRGALRRGEEVKVGTTTFAGA